MFSNIIYVLATTSLLAGSSITFYKSNKDEPEEYLYLIVLYRILQEEHELYFLHFQIDSLIKVLFQFRKLIKGFNIKDLFNCSLII